jgi:ABC-2 type transport system permease protein
MAEELMPGWMRAIARYNPVNWAVGAGREALRADANWALVFLRLGWLLLLGIACGWLATRAFRSYQRSV